MPIFEYQCEDCEKTFQELVRSSESAGRVSCSHCGSAHVLRLFSAFAAGAGQKDRSPRRSESPWSGGGGGGSCGSGCGCHR